jgi:hypothetical protein
LLEGMSLDKLREFEMSGHKVIYLFLPAQDAKPCHRE